MRKVLLAAAAAFALVSAYGCSSDCEAACDKINECKGELCGGDAACEEAITCGDEQIKDCETELEGDNAEAHQKLLDCYVDKECADLASCATEAAE